MNWTQLEKDLEASTPGPWRIKNCEEYGDRCLNFYQEIWNEETDILVTTEVTRTHNDGGKANMRIISRAPDLAALAIAGKRACDELDMQIRNCPLCKGTGKAVHAEDLLYAEEGWSMGSDCQRCRSARDARDAFHKAEGESHE